MATMSVEEVDFTAEFALSGFEATEAAKSNADGTVTCFGLVVWFDVEFSSRFCKDFPVTMSTSPLGPKTHWAQTLLTFKQPFVMLEDSKLGGEVGEDCLLAESVGTKDCPASVLKGRMSIARGLRHRSIDISLEVTVVSGSGLSRSLPAQIFEM